MVDLEGTLCARLPGPGMDNTTGYYLRPNAHEFLTSGQESFDEIYLFTSVPEQYAREAMERIGFLEYNYQNKHREPGMQVFEPGDLVYLVDDDTSLQKKCDTYGVQLFNVNHFDPTSEEEAEKDTELDTILEKILSTLD